MKKKSIRICVIAILLLNFISIRIADAESRTIYVDDDNTNGPWLGTLEYPFQHIQDGIDAAENNDTVYVFSGTYYETLNITKPINLIGENKADTIINCIHNFWYCIIHLKASYINIDNFTIANGYIRFPNCIGIYSNEYSKNAYINITNCIITNNGCGIFFANATNSSINNCTIYHHWVCGCAIQGSSSNINISFCRIYDTFGGSSGGSPEWNGINIQICGELGYNIYQTIKIFKYYII